MKWIKEIKKVGFKNWLWFVFYLRRDEFSPKLDLLNYWPDLDRLVADRDKAHNIDIILNEIKK